jgi:hypothetical protein
MPHKALNDVPYCRRPNAVLKVCGGFSVGIGDCALEETNTAFFLSLTVYVTTLVQIPGIRSFERQDELRRKLR